MPIRYQSQFHHLQIFNSQEILLQSNDGTDIITVVKNVAKPFQQETAVWCKVGQQDFFWQVCDFAVYWHWLHTEPE